MTVCRLDLVPERCHRGLAAVIRRAPFRLASVAYQWFAVRAQMGSGRRRSAEAGKKRPKEMRFDGNGNLSFHLCELPFSFARRVSSNWQAPSFTNKRTRQA